MVGSLILGFFDGVHLAHRQVIYDAVLHSCERHTVLVTLKDSPSLYFNHEVEYIMPRKKSIDIIKSLGVDEVFELDFAKVVDINADFFLRYIVNKYSPSCIFTGYNHTFGFNKRGNPEFIEKNKEKFGYQYFCIPEYKINEEVVSSTAIKQFLKEGNIEKANKFLGSNFSIEGTVIKGMQIGKTIGFPTANIKYPENIVKIPYGVYKVTVELDKTYDGIMNWGIKPTVNNSEEPVAEVHIINYNGDLYYKDIQIQILKYIRPEQKFLNIDELKKQIEKDLVEC